MAKIQEIAPELLQFSEAAAPSAPASGVVRIYAKSDGLLYSMDDAGNETLLSGATAVGVSVADTAEHFTGTDVETVLAELFQFVSDGKTLVAAAITDKGVTTAATDSFSTMATNIGDISSGAAPVTSGDYRVRFIDYDGTISLDTWVDSGGSITPPANPDHTADGLTFQEWNYASSAVTNITHDLDVGATYITTDSKTHLHITLTAISGLAPTLYLNKSDTSELTVDWGDGNTSTFTNSGNFNTGAHTYSAAGDYIIKLWISSGSGTYKIGQADFSAGILYGYAACLTKAFIGANVSQVTDYAFFGCTGLLYISMPANVSVVGVSALQACYSLISLTIPSGITTLTAVAQACYSLVSVSLPISLLTIGGSSFTDTNSLSHIVIPPNVTTIGSAAFSYSKISRLAIPNGVSLVADSICSNCFALAELTLGTGVITISNNAFISNRSLKKVEIPASVTSIGTEAFKSSYCITEYLLHPTTPPTFGSGALTGINTICRIKVPAASLAAYQAAANWSTYANYMEGY